MLRIGHRVLSPLMIGRHPPYPEMGKYREGCAAHTADYCQRLSVARAALADEVAHWPEFRSYLDERGLLVVRQDPSPAP